MQYKTKLEDISNFIRKAESKAFDEPTTIMIGRSKDGEPIPADDSLDNHKLHPDPFLIAGTKIASGQGTALILAVGKNTYLNRS
jgi:magnesium-transporting ATPase (P-type)